MYLFFATFLSVLSSLRAMLATVFAPVSAMLASLVLAVLSVVWSLSCMLSSMKTSWLSLVRRYDVQQRPMPALSVARQWTAVSIVSSLFFIWGFAYGLLDTMNYHVKGIMDMDNDRKKVALLATGYYTPYLLCPILMSGPMIKSWGYRWTFIAGLLLFTLGNFVMGGAAKNTSFPGMIVAMFIVGMGVSTLERAANPYAAKVGPAGTSELRLVFAQGAAAIGTIVAPLLAAQCIPEATGPAAIQKLPAIIELYNAIGYGILGLVVIFMFLFFGTTWVPEVVELSNSATGNSATSVPGSLVRRVWSHPIWSHRRLWCAWVANFLNVSNQVIIAQFFMEYAIDNGHLTGAKRERQAQHYLSVAQAFFAVGRYVFVVMILWIRPRLSISLFVVLAGVAVALATKLDDIAGTVMLWLAMFAEGPTFPTIFATGIRNLGEFDSLGESILIMSISGGGFGPAIFGVLTDKTRKINIPLWFPAACFLGPVLAYVVGLNTVWRKEFDKDWYAEKKAKADRKKQKAEARDKANGNGNSGETTPVEDVEMQSVRASSDQEEVEVQPGRASGDQEKVRTEGEAGT